MLKEFKEFIMRGNVLDLAVGFVMGAAFTAIVNSLVNHIIMPLVGMAAGGINFEDLVLNVGDARLQYGLFLNAVINFLLIALVLFIIVKIANKFRRPKEQEGPQEVIEEVELALPLTEQYLKEIRDLLADQQKHSTRL